MKNYLYIILAVISIFCLKTNAAEDTNAKSFSATFIDKQNVTSLVHKLNYRPRYLNENFAKVNVLYGTRGDSEVTIPWKNIKRIDFISFNKKYNATASLRDGRKIYLQIDEANTTYKGDNDFGGVFEIRTDKIRSIIFK